MSSFAIDFSARNFIAFWSDMNLAFKSLINSYRLTERTWDVEFVMTGILSLYTARHSRLGKLVSVPLASGNAASGAYETPTDRIGDMMR